MKIEFNTDFSSEEIAEMREVYRSAGWMKHTNEVIKQVFEASSIIVIAKSEGRIIGFGRALSDGVFNAAIYDVVIHKEFQDQGIAKHILQVLLNKLSGVS